MKKTAIGSFAYRYAVGFNGFRPPEPMDPFSFLKRAKQLDYQGVQLCENLHYAQMEEKDLSALDSLAKELGLFVEIGMNGASKENLLFHLKLARKLSSSFVRVVLGGKSCKKAAEVGEAQTAFTKTLKEVLPAFRDQGISLGIENHFDLPTYAIRNIVDELDDENVGMILDTTNCIHFLERPLEALEMSRGKIISVHIKDYMTQKMEAGHLITGTELGKGELDIPPFIACCDRIVLEMTIRRNETMTPEAITEWEDQAIEESTKTLIRLCQAAQ